MTSKNSYTWNLIKTSHWYDSHRFSYSFGRKEFLYHINTRMNEIKGLLDVHQKQLGSFDLLCKSIYAGYDTITLLALSKSTYETDGYLIFSSSERLRYFNKKIDSHTRVLYEKFRRSC